MIVNVGKKMQIYAITGDTTTMGIPSYMAIGTGTTAETLNDTALQSEVYRVGFLSGYPSRDLTNFRITYRSQFNITASYNISEIGLFTASSGGNMFNRKTFGAIPVANGDTLTFDVVISYCRSIRCPNCNKLLSFRLFGKEIFKRKKHICSVKPNGKGRNIHVVVYERAESRDEPWRLL